MGILEGSFPTEECNLLGLSSSHHPQTNGSCEHTNGMLEYYIHCYINYQQDNWSDRLPFAEVAYNNSMHNSTGFVPLCVAMGWDFVSIFKLP
ncbi:Tf2-1: Tf2-1 [Crotalus adamanteus]|uniref:Tf2-1: Tf2-1 n=1 Tax=Crotalus adamanteus TaxID=8729 RepID=A0AAW1C243_CROAD